jgi:hypothetical protein
MKTITYEKHPKRLPRSVFVRALVKSCVAVFSPGAVLSWGSGMPFSRPWWMRPWWRRRPQQQEVTSERTSLNVDGQRVLLPSVKSDAYRCSQQKLQALERSLSYIPDLTERFGLTRIGYLVGGYPYTKGATSKAFFDRLVELVGSPFTGSMGFHTCDLGRCGRGPGLSRLGNKFRYHARTLTCGNSEILVPSSNVIYCAPSMILHYIRCHGYAPPPPFVEAVLNCPAPRSREYCTAITTIAPEMITSVGEPLAEDESFTVEFDERLSSEEIEFWADGCFAPLTVVEHPSERTFRVLCSTSAQLKRVLRLWREFHLAAVCRTTTTPGDIEALCNKWGVRSNRKQFPQQNS